MFDVLAAAAVIAMSSHYSQAPADTSVVTVEEDDPAFDCRTMGNLRCGAGAVLPDGTLAIPGDCSPSRSVVWKIRTRFTSSLIASSRFRLSPCWACG